MDHTGSPEATPLEQLLGEPLTLNVQPSMFGRDFAPPLLASINLSIVDGCWHAGLTLMRLDSLEDLAMTVTPDFDGTPSPEVVAELVQVLLAAADVASGPFAP